MCASCFEGVARTFLYITNLLLFLVSCAALGLSIWILVDSPSFLEVVETTGGNVNIYTSGSIIILTTSVLVLIVTFFGCCGAAKDSRCMLGTYFVLVLLILIGVGVGAYFVFAGDLDKLEKPFIESLKKYDPKGNNAADRALVEVWDNFQQDYKCCGVESWKDWKKYNDYFKPDVIDPRLLSNPVVPASCCAQSSQQDECTLHPTTSLGAYVEGCFDKVVNEINKHSKLVGGISIGVLVTMVLNCIIAGYMATCGYQSTRQNYR